MSSSSRNHWRVSLFKKTCLSMMVAMALSSHAAAQQSSKETSYAVPAGDLVQAINQISRDGGVQIVYDIELLRGKRSPEIRGVLTLEKALDRALLGSGLGWTRVNDRTVSVHVLPIKATRRKRETGQRPAADMGQQESAVKNLDNIVVVGSRLGVSPVESSMPIKVIDRQQIERSGATGVAQVLSQLSEVSISNNGDSSIGGTAVELPGSNINASTVQMRGLARGTTLVLINGRRAGHSSSFSSSGQFDLSTIPLSLVDRIEVLPSGASAAYGGDGLAGVINIVLRQDADVTELTYRKGATKGQQSTQIGALWSKSSSKGMLTANVTWRESNALLASERGLTADLDYRRFGGNDWRVPNGNPATIYSLDGCPAAPDYCYSSLEERGSLPGLNSPVATVPDNQNGLGLTPEDFLATQGMENTVSPIQHLLSAEKSHAIGVSGNLKLGSRTEFFVEWTHSRRSVPALEMPVGFSYGVYGGPSIVPASSPYNPFGVDVGIDYYYKSSGRFSTYSATYTRALAGLRGSLGGFDWEIASVDSGDKSKSDGGFGFDSQALSDALASGEFNPFVADGTAPASPEVMATLLRPLNHDSSSRSRVTTGFLKGDVFENWAGKVSALAGLEYQRIRFKLNTDSETLYVSNVEGSSSSRAVFAEVKIPLIGKREGDHLERLALTGATRRETGDRFEGAATTETLGLTYRPTSSLLLRSTYSTAFRPLLTYNAVLSPVYGYASFADPRFGGQFFDISPLIDGGVPPGIKPETSRTTTLGFVYSPAGAWSISATHWNIQFRDRIAFIDAQTLIDNEEFYPGRIRRNEVSGFVEEMDLRQVNINLSSSKGVDLEVDGVIETPVGSFYPSLSATYTFEYEVQLVPGSPMVNALGYRRGSGWSPRWKIVPKVSWEATPQFTSFLAGRYVSRYRDSERLVTGDNAGKYLMLGDFWVFDLNMQATLGNRLVSAAGLSAGRLSFGVTNVFNRLPDFCAGCGPRGYDSGQYDIVGRSVYAEVKVEF